MAQQAALEVTRSVNMCRSSSNANMTPDDGLLANVLRFSAKPHVHDRLPPSERIFANPTTHTILLLFLKSRVTFIRSFVRSCSAKTNANAGAWSAREAPQLSLREIQVRVVVVDRSIFDLSVRLNVVMRCGSL